MKINDHYNVIIIGSSPLMLIEAICQKKSGKSVLIIEKKNIIGGSWHTFDINDFCDDIEIGCHVWQKNKKVINFLNRYFDMDCQPLVPQPKVIFKKIFFSYSFIYLFMIYREIQIRNFNKNNFSLIISLLGSFLKQFFNKAKYYYPAGGSKVLIEKLEERVNNSNILLLKNNLVEIINCNNKTIVCSNNKNITFDEINITNKTEIENFIENDNTFYNTKVKISVIHNLFILIHEKDYLNPISYCETHGNNFIYRISDMTYENEMLKNKALILLSVDIFRSAYENFKNEELKRIIIIQLKNLKILDSETQILKYFFNTYSYNGNGNETAQELRASSLDSVNIFESNNFIPSLNNHIERWKFLLSIKKQ